MRVEWRIEESIASQSRRSGRTEWFRGKEKNKSVVFVPATPRSELKNRYVKVIAEAGVKLAVAEVPGTSLKRKLQRLDPFKVKKCESVTAWCVLRVMVAGAG